MDKRGLPLRAASVRRMADLLLANRASSTPGTTSAVGQCWVRNFVKRHPELQSKYSRKYDYQRAQCEDPKIIQNWFRLVQNTIAKYGILAQDIYNFDETGFQMGMITTAKVITGSKRAGRPTVTQPGNREWVTAIEAINSTGWALPPMIIFQGKLHQASWYNDELIPSNWTIGLSENGWTNDKLALFWLQEVFDKYTKARTVGAFRLLILDGHGSHATPDFDHFCSEHSIIVLCMPPHSSHLLQPLDVGCFSPLKKAYGRKVEESIRLGINHTDKIEFLRMFQEARTEALNQKNIQSGFTATGLDPFNPDQVLTRLHTQLRTPSPLPTEGLLEQPAWIPETPHNPTGVERQTRTIKELLKRRTTSPPSPADRALNQLVKGCQLAMHNAVLLTNENNSLRAANQKQKRKREQPRSYVGAESALTGEESTKRAKNAKIRAEEVVSGQNLAAQTRAPSKCSICSSLEHTARTCSERSRI